MDSVFVPWPRFLLLLRAAPIIGGSRIFVLAVSLHACVDAFSSEKPTEARGDIFVTYAAIYSHSHRNATPARDKMKED